MRLLFGVGGGIAAYKAADALSRLRQAGADVRVILTEAATKLVAPLTFEALSGHPVHTDLFAPSPEGWTIPHVALADWAELCLVAPATADLLARLAHGAADDMLTTTLLVFPGPVLLAPAMNRFMWAHPAVQDNLARLRSFGYRVLSPGFGHLAEGVGGWGRLPEPDAIVAAVRELEAEGLPPRRELAPPALAGVGVLVTAGPTWEPVDPMRLLTNASSGRMGWALAESARDRGARVTLVAGPTALADPPGVRVVRVKTALEMQRAVDEAFPDSRVVIAAAAVSDWRPAEPSETKLKKGGAGDELVLRLVRNPDILASLGQRKGERVLVGFAAEAGGGLDEARRKLRDKRLDLIVFNEADAFGAEGSRVTILSADGRQEEMGPLPKRTVAERIIDRVGELLQQGE